MLTSQALWVGYIWGYSEQIGPEIILGRNAEELYLSACVCTYVTIINFPPYYKDKFIVKVKNLHICGT